MQTLPRLGIAACVLCLAACQRPAGDDDGTALPAPASTAAPVASAGAPATPASTGTPAAAADAPAAYACDDGTRLQARFGEHDAMLRWADGRSITLPRAESASKGGGDVYVGDTVSLQRDGTRLQLHDGQRDATRCDPAGPVPAAGEAASGNGTGLVAAARYACDADTRLVRNGDGSFRAEIPGNPSIRLTRIAGSSPPVYTGGSLYLRIGDGGAILSQGDRSNELRCTAG